MKKVLSLSLALCALVVLSGCGSKNSKYEETMKEYATNWYNSYVKGTQDLTEKTVSIKDLKDANTYANANYDLSKLKDCTEDSYATIKINKSNNEIESITYNLSCNK